MSKASDIAAPDLSRNAVITCGRLALAIAKQAYVVEPGRIVTSVDAKEIGGSADIRKSHL
jgi:ABC-type branched-subunit amino acid transport system ATPase component